MTKHTTYSVIISYKWNSTRFAGLKNMDAKDTILINAKNKAQACRKAYRTLVVSEKKTNEEISRIVYILPTRINLNAIQHYLDHHNNGLFI